MRKPKKAAVRVRDLSSTLLIAAAFATAITPSLGLAKDKAEAATERRGAAAYLLADCPTSAATAAEGAFLAVAASFAADFIVGAVEKWIAQRKADLSGQFVAGTSTPQVFSSPSALSFGCLVVASGEFGALRPGLADMRGDITVGTIDKLGLADYPDFYLEAKASLDGRTVTLQPAYLDYRETSAVRPGKGQKKVVAIVGFSSKSLAADAKATDENTFALYRFNLGELEIGKIYKGDDIFTGTSVVQEMPAPLADGKFVPKPANVTVFVAETENPSLALELLTSAFASNKDALNKAIEDAIKKALGEQEAKKS